MGWALARHRSKPRELKVYTDLRTPIRPTMAGKGFVVMERSSRQPVPGPPQPRSVSDAESRLSIPAAWGQACRLVWSAGQGRFHRWRSSAGPAGRHTDSAAASKSRHGTATATSSWNGGRRIGSRSCSLIMATAWLAKCCTDHHRQGFPGQLSL
jgi:hypothetical protein